MTDAKKVQGDWSTPPLSMRAEWKCVQVECGEQSVEWVSVMPQSFVDYWAIVEVG